MTGRKLRLMRLIDEFTRSPPFRYGYVLRQPNDARGRRSTGADRAPRSTIHARHFASSIGRLSCALQMESYPKSHNEVGVPIVRIGCREFKCIGDKARNPNLIPQETAQSRGLWDLTS
jgi:hypothetical protein